MYSWLEQKSVEFSLLDENLTHSNRDSTESGNYTSFDFDGHFVDPTGDLQFTFKAEPQSISQKEVFLTAPNSQLVSASPSVDTLFDDTRDIIYFSTTSGTIERYDLATSSFLTAIDIGGTLGDMSISLDGSTLFVAQQEYVAIDDSGSWPDHIFETSVHEINLDTLSIENQAFTVTGQERGAYDVALNADNELLVTTNFSGSGWNPFREFSGFDGTPDSQTVSGLSSIRQSSSLEVTRDGQHVLIVESNTSNVPFHLYETATGQIIDSNDFYALGSSGFNEDHNAISGESELIAISTYNNLFVLDFNLDLKASLSSLVGNSNRTGVQFSADGNQLFLWTIGQSIVRVIDTQSFEQVGTLDVSIVSSWDRNNSYAQMLTSADGTYLILDGSNSFEIINLRTDMMLNISGTIADDIVNGGVGDDILDGGDGNDTILAGDGNDSIEGGAGNDLVDGGSGINTASYIGSSSGVSVDLGIVGGQDTLGAGIDTLIGIQNLIGSEFGDTLVGDSMGNEFNGGAGNDIIAGNDGDDNIDGGEGLDTAVYNLTSSSDYIFVNNSDGSFTVTANSGSEGSDTLRGIEILRINGVDIGVETLVSGPVFTESSDNYIGLSIDEELDGLAGDDNINAGAGDDMLIGGAGADMLDGGSGTDWVDYSGASVGVRVYLDGTAGLFGDATGDVISNVENLEGTSFSDRLTGNTDANRIDGNGGEDVIIGRAGNDKLYGNNGNDDIDGGGDNDQIFGGAGDDVLTGNAGDDRLFGGEGADNFTGGSGRDRVEYSGSSVGVTVDFSNIANNTGEAAGDIFTSVENIRGSNHDDILTGDAGVNWLFGIDGNDTLSGGAGLDRLFGGEGNDTLIGGDYGDYIYGNADADTLIGEAGNDKLFGGSGADIFVFAQGGGKDNIFDWEDGVDLVDVTAYTLAEVNIALANATQVGASVRITFDTGDHIQFRNTDLADIDINDFITAAPAELPDSKSQISEALDAPSLMQQNLIAEFLMQSQHLISVAINIDDQTLVVVDNEAPFEYDGWDIL